MRFWLKLNGVSALYGWLFFLITAILLNPSRIAEVTGLSLHAVVIGFVVILILGASILAFWIPWLVQRWMNGRAAALWSTILWFPYWLLFALFFVALFPNRHPYDDDNYGAAFAILGLIFAYPFYLGLTTFLGIYAGKRPGKL